MMEIIRKSLLASLALVLVMQGCGGGGGSSDDPVNTGDSTGNDTTIDSTDSGFSGAESQATVDQANVKDLAVATVSGITQAVEENGVTGPFSIPATAARSIEPTEEMHQQTTAEVCIHGGEAIVEEITEEAGQWLNVFYLNNCSYGEGLHINTFTGRVRHTFSDHSNAFDYVMIGTVSSVGNASRDINWRLSCDATFRCSSSSDFLGIDGRTYRVSAIDITDDGSSVYTASGRIYDPYHGYIDVTTEVPYSIDCANGRPGTGRLNFTGADQTSGYLEFVSCAEYIVATSNGASSSYRW
ncbi:MAG: hypothetical protein KME65_13720 [Candidatus Thiodiazotropha sp. (ex Ctena orbiculata)]|uniref:Lipoprotein n=1 Tax=Candidatus Thiodiazotropha taylori TaxID=2792791 RepID=A0A944MAW3_9GAMM|nr:hypothetical protein [Candidatus Thiodiazotropha taylori]MBV2137006.1 hypothetical protein [Candidatus Thiodiazotropha taylori]